MRTTVLAALFLLLACGREAVACSCVPPPGEPTHVWHKDRLASYFSHIKSPGDAAFLGKVTKIEEVSRGAGDTQAYLQVTFAVEKIWANPWAREGFDESVIRAWTYKGDGMCGVAFAEGRRYFVFTNNYAESHLCTPTAEYRDDEAADYFKALGQGREPAKPAPER